MADPIEQQGIPPSPDPEAKPKRGRKPGAVSRKQLEETVGTAIMLANMQVIGMAQSGNWKAQVFVLSEPELEQETKACCDLILSYPGLAKWVGRVSAGGPWLNFLMVQYLIFGPRIARLKTMQTTQEAPADDQHANGTGSGEIPPFPAIPTT